MLDKLNELAEGHGELKPIAWAALAMLAGHPAMAASTCSFDVPQFVYAQNNTNCVPASSSYQGIDVSAVILVDSTSTMNAEQVTRVVADQITSQPPDASAVSNAGRLFLGTMAISDVSSNPNFPRGRIGISNAATGTLQSTGLVTIRGHLFGIVNQGSASMHSLDIEALMSPLRLLSGTFTVTGSARLVAGTFYGVDFSNESGSPTVLNLLGGGEIRGLTGPGAGIRFWGSNAGSVANLIGVDVFDGIKFSESPVSSPVQGPIVNLTGGRLNGGMSSTQPDSWFVFNAGSGAVVNGDVLSSALDTATTSRVSLSSGSTMNGAIRYAFPSTIIVPSDNAPANVHLTLNDATWNLTASSSLRALSNGAGGKVDFGGFSGAYKTLTVKDYVGGGDITFNTFLGDSSSPSDKLVINAGSATGSSRVFVRNTGGLGAQTTGNGILLIEAINGGTTSPSAFTLGQPVIAGAYDYSLLRSGENWYLSSAVTTVQAPQPIPDPTPAPEPTTPPAQNFRAESSLFASLPSQALAGMGLALEVPTAPPSPPVSVKVASNDSRSALVALAEREQLLEEPKTWVRLISTRARNRAEGQSTNGARWAQFDANAEMLQGGRRVAQETQGATRSSVSLIGALGSVSGSASHTNTAGVHIAGSNKVEVASLGAAWSQRFDAKAYLDTVVQLSHLRATSASVRGLGFKTSGTGVSAALEAGYQLSLSPGWKWQPHGILRTMQANLRDTRDQAGQVRMNRARSTQAGLGVTLHTESERATQLSATARLLHESSGKPETVLADEGGNNGQAFHSNTQGSSVQLKLGVEHRMGKGSRLFASVNHTQGLNSGNKRSRDSGATLGARFEW